MAKTNNLTDFLTDVADAIREKEGSSAPINPQDFSAKIRAIQGGGESGGGGASASAGAVNFRDYDGTILHSFSKADFLALSELPSLPTQSGLTCQGWNWNLADAKAYVGEYGVLEVGATYITDDGKTRLYITLDSETRMDFSFKFSVTATSATTTKIVVDWGDGSTESINKNRLAELTHHYASIGDYIISLEVKDATRLTFGQTTSGSYATFTKPYNNMVRRVELGNKTFIANYAFGNCYSLSSVVIPNDIQSFGAYCFQNCYLLSSVVIPNDIQSFGTYCFQNCYSLSSVVIPNSITDLPSYFCQNCYSLSSVVIPNSVTKINTYAFNFCESLFSVVIPNSVKSIASYAFSSCRSLPKLEIPNSVTSIGNLFASCVSLKSLTFPEDIDSTSANNISFSGCYSLPSIALPKNMTKINSSVFSNCYSLHSVEIPDGVTSIGSSAFENCKALVKIEIPAAVTSLGSKAFYACSSIPFLRIPKGVTRIPANTFYSCSGLAFLDFSTHLAVPTLSNINALSTIASDCKIVIPDELYDEWIASTNWSNSGIVAKIIKASEFTY